MSENIKYINTWLFEHNISLEPVFADRLREYAEQFKKNIMSPYGKYIRCFAVRNRISPIGLRIPTALNTKALCTLY